MASATNDSVEPRQTRPGNRALQDGELVSEQGDLSEQRPARAKGGGHGADEREKGVEHGRAKVAPMVRDFAPIREVATTTHLHSDIATYSKARASRLRRPGRSTDDRTVGQMVSKSRVLSKARKNLEELLLATPRACGLARLPRQDI
jgi:hypothetical protein